MKALVMNDTVLDVEKRDIDVYEYYHKDIADLFVDCPEDVKIGYLYNEGKFVNPDERPETEQVDTDDVS